MIHPTIILVMGIIALGIWALIKLKNEFSERLFFKIGMGLFLIQGFSNSWGLYLDWGLLPLWAIISKVSGILFNFLIAYFFFWLMKKAPASMGGAGINLSEQELKDFMKGVKTK